ncbi:MAG: 3-hydroxy-5-phosphonooxypentane-2,4-dione thiolase [Armatimonadota bacterium]
MNWGLENRLAQIIKPETNRTVMLAIDHGYFQGPTTGLEAPGKTVEPLLPYCDALSPTKGVLQYCIDAKTAPPIILRVSGGNSMMRRDELSDEVLTCTAEEAVRLNAAAVSVSIYVGTEHQRRTIENLARMADAAHNYGLAVLGVTAVGTALDELREPGKEQEFARYLALAGRIAAEHGADISKTYYVGDGHFEKVAGGTPVPIVIAGGKKVPEQEALDFSYRAIQDGAIGVDMGRNIFQSENPAAMIQAVRSVVHEGKSSQEAYELFQELAS